MILQNIRYNLGMNRNINPSLIRHGEWKTIINGELNRIGIIEKRKGYKKILNNPDNSEVLSLIRCELGDIRRLIMVTATGNIYSADPSVDDNWGNPVKTGVDNSERWGWAVMSDKDGNKFLIMGNGHDVLKTSDGLTFTDVPGAPKARYWTVYQQRVFCSGVDADPDVVHWSSIGDLTDWSVIEPSDSGSINIDKFSNGIVKAIIEANNKVVIYKDREMKRWDQENLRNVLTSWGTEAPYSVIKINGLPFSFDRDGIRMYDGNIPIKISDNIQDIVDRVDISRPERIFAVDNRGRYYLFVGDIEDENMLIKNAVIVYDEAKSLWWLHSLNHKMTSGTTLRRSGDNRETVYMGDINGQVYEMNVGDEDDGLSIEMILESHIIYPEGIGNDIKPKRVGIISKNPNQMKVFLRADYDKKEVLMGEVDDNAQRFDTQKMPIDTHGVSVLITHATKGRPQVYGYNIGYEVETGRRNER